MATFKIHQDAEKENPINIKSMNIKSNVLQPVLGATKPGENKSRTFGVVSNNTRMVVPTGKVVCI